MAEQKIWNVAAYARLSREDGDKDESNSIGSQKVMIRDYIQNHSDMVIVQEYVDDGFSGVNFDRPGFQQMLEDLKAKKVNCVICKDLSRFGRNYIDSGRYLEKTFPAMGVRFIAINDSYDSFGERSQADSLIVPFKNLINDAYCRDISMKIRSQLDIKRKTGDFIGSFATYGYRKDPENKNKLLVDEPAAQVVELIFRLRMQGLSNSRIADRLNDMGVLTPMAYKHSKGENYKTGFRTNDITRWSEVAVRRILTNEIYLGTLIQHTRGTPNYKLKKQITYAREDWIIVEENHEAIIKETDFETVQSLLKRDIRVAPDREEAYLFAGYVYCGDCHRAMARQTVKYKGKKYLYLTCSTHKHGQGCSTHRISETKLTKIVLQAVQNHVRLICEIDRLLNYIAALPEQQRQVFNYDAQITRLEAEVERFQNLKLNLYSDMADGVISKGEYLEFREGYDRKITERQRAILRIQEERTLAIQREDRSNSWVGIFKQYANIAELQRPVIVNLVDEIVIYDETHIEVQFRYMDQLRSMMEYVERFTEVIPQELQKGA